MKKFFLFFWIIIFIACNQKKETKPSVDINDIARQYVKLALNIGKYDGDFVDAYYGPDSLKPDTIKLDAFPKDSFLNAVDKLINQLKEIQSTNKNDTTVHRAKWITDQLTAFSRRIKIFSGEESTFDIESKRIIWSCSAGT